MYDHIGLRVKDIEVSKRFYRATLEALGLEAGGKDNVEAVCQE